MSYTMALPFFQTIHSVTYSSISYLTLPFFVILLLYLIFCHFTDPLSHIPGPLVAKYNPLWLAYHARKGDMHVTMIGLHKKYGNLVRTAPNEVSTADPAAIRLIYGMWIISGGCQDSKMEGRSRKIDWSFNPN